MQQAKTCWSNKNDIFKKVFEILRSMGTNREKYKQDPPLLESKY